MLLRCELSHRQTCIQVGLLGTWALGHLLNLRMDTFLNFSLISARSKLENKTVIIITKREDVPERNCSCSFKVYL